LHRQDESRTNGHDPNHRKCIDAHRQHLPDCGSPPVLISDKRQSSSQGTYGVPKLNYQGAYILNLTQGRGADTFNNGYAQGGLSGHWLVTGGISGFTSVKRCRSRVVSKR
jgi:hypothetical protein